MQSGPCTNLYVRHHAYEQMEQVALLSQRDRAMLRVIEYFAKSLKATQGHSN